MQKMSKQSKENIVPQYACDREGCRKTFTWRMQLQRHKKKCTKPTALKKEKGYICDNNVFKCASCEWKTEYRKSIIRHVDDNICHKKKPVHKCTICDNLFDHKSRMLKHMKQHQKTDRQTCMSCNAVFRRADQFAKHAKTCFLPSQVVDINDVSSSSFTSIFDSVVDTHVDGSYRLISYSYKENSKMTHREKHTSCNGNDNIIDSISYLQ